MRVHLSASLLRRAMLARGLSQVQLAEAAGVSRDTVGAALHGRPLNLPTATRIGRALSDAAPLPMLSDLILVEDA